MGWGRFGWIVVGAVVLGAGILVALNVLNQANDQKPLDNPIARANELKTEANKPKPDSVPEGYVEAGGVLRPKQDVQLPKSEPRPDENTRQALFPDPGRTPSVKPDANKSVESVAEAFGKPELAHRLTSLVPAPAFDPVAYQNDPDAYLESIEPGRIWQSLPKGPDVVPLKRTSAFYHEVLQGEKVNLEAKATAGLPVTFSSARLGQFDNLLSVITVKADEDGIARAAFLASSGTRGEIDILASSPVHSGQVRYLIKVIVPRTAANVRQGELPGG